MNTYKRTFIASRYVIENSKNGRIDDPEEEIHPDVSKALSIRMKADTGDLEPSDEEKIDEIINRHKRLVPNAEEVREDVIEKNGLQ